MSEVHPASVREGLFAGVVSENQHQFSLINFKTVYSGLLWFIAEGPSECSLYKHWKNAVLCLKSILHLSGKPYLQE